MPLSYVRFGVSIAQSRAETWIDEIVWGVGGVNLSSPILAIYSNGGLDEIKSSGTML